LGRESLAGKTGLVTGGAVRVGRAIALALADEGADVIVHYNRSESEAQELVRDIEGRGVRAWALGADLANPEECGALMDRAVSIAGLPYILVNSASIFPKSSIEDVDLSGLLENVRINAWAPFVLSREFAGKVRQGRIINILDTRVSGFDFSHVAYIWSKQMLAVMTRYCAIEFAPGITVNAVAPGLILPPAGKDESYLERLAQTIPLKRHGDPEHIADAAIFLAKNDFITGQIVYVDGGRHLKEYADG